MQSLLGILTKLQGVDTLNLSKNLINSETLQFINEHFNNIYFT